MNALLTRKRCGTNLAAMTSKPMTSEERLLNLIRKKNQASPNVEAKKETEGPKKEQSTNNPKSEFRFDVLKVLNRIFFVLSLLIFGYILMKYAGGHDKKEISLEEREETKKEEKKEEKIVSGQKLLQENKPFALYQTKIEQRDLFHSPWDKPKEAVSDAVTANTEFSKQLKLIGVVLDEDPKAIIEDTKTRETVFLSVGESISGAVIEEIKEGKVILRLNEEKVELLQ